MNKEWAEMNRAMQASLAGKETFRAGIGQLIALRDTLFDQITRIVKTYPEEAFSLMPFAGADGYHAKTLAYSIWHIFRIEDIVAHEMIAEDRQVLLDRGFQERIRAPLITTGNELAGEEIAAFSAQLDIRQLYLYALEVKRSTDEILKSLSYPDLRRKFGEEMTGKLQRTGCVSSAESAAWLIDYWCGKDVLGLIRMPFSRHWIMHTEAMLRIKNRLCRLARKGVDPVAYCGLSCNHCYLGEWCGSCRTAYNTCSYATVSPDGQCPNAACCREQGIDGCWACGRLETCQKGFYTPANDGAEAAKAQAVYIRDHGKKEFLKVNERLRSKYEFVTMPEILGQDWREGLRFLEEN